MMKPLCSKILMCLKNSNSDWFNCIAAPTQLLCYHTVGCHLHRNNLSTMQQVIHSSTATKTYSFLLSNSLLVGHIPIIGVATVYLLVINL